MNTLYTILLIFFTSWFLFSIAYVFNSNKMGRLGGWLKRYGWLHQWAMFTSQSDPYKKIAFYYRDQNELNETSEWIRVDVYNALHSNKFINTKEREFTFYTTCSRILSKKISQGIVITQDDPVFHFVSQVICDIEKQHNKMNRQIKLVQLNPTGEHKCISKSKFLPVNGN